MQCGRVGAAAEPGACLHRSFQSLLNVTIKSMSLVRVNLSSGCIQDFKRGNQANVSG